MSGGFKGGASRASIPSGVRKTIENIKEITGQNHSEDEIYAMLKECSMDPNETTQKLLLLDTFHEVKRKRDKRKENLNKEPAESKWKPGPQGRANRVSRGNYPSRYTSQDGGRNMAAVKENTGSHHSEKGTSKVPLATSPDMRKYENSSASPTTGVSNGPSGIVSESTNVIHEKYSSVGEGVNQSNTAAVVSIKNSNAPVNKGTKQHKMLELSNSESSFPSLPAAESYITSDTTPLPSQDVQVPGAVGTILRKSRTQRAPTKPLEDNLTESKSASAKISASEIGVTNLEEKMANDFQEVGKNQHLESTQAASSTVSRPSSNHSNRSQVNGPQKVSPGKEWKPKSTNPNIGSSGTTAGSSQVSAVSIGSNSELSQTTPGVIASKVATLDLQKKLEETQISDSQHVIIPNHLHVPEVGKLGFCFGSFDASFELDMDHNVVPDNEKSPQLSELSEPTDAPVKDLQLSNQNALPAPDDTETKYHDHPQSPSEAPANFSASEIEVSSNIDPKPEPAPGSHQHHLVHISPNYTYGFMPSILGGQLPSSESSESQPRDASQLPAIVPQSFDPAAYYAQFYRPSIDSDGRISPFHTAGASNKYNTNAPTQTSQTPQELQVLSTPSQTPTPNPNQQHVPVFRQPTGVHLPHYPPNYIPYGHYFPPFYVPPPAIHHFLSNAAFPQQPPYPTPPATNTKYTVSQYKQVPNTGGSTHVGSYGPANGEITAPQTKENNAYATGQQNESSGVWFGRDISALQGGSFYNVPQAQLAFPGHGPFAFHPGPAMTAANVHPILQQSQPDNVGPTTGVYHQSNY